MPAYVVAYLEVTDSQTFNVYRQAAVSTLAPFGGKPLVVDGKFDVLEGMVHPKSVVVLEFPSAEQARRWYASGEYRQALPLRQRSANTSLLVVEGLPA